VVVEVCQMEPEGGFFCGLCPDIPYIGENPIRHMERVHGIEEWDVMVVHEDDA